MERIKVGKITLLKWVCEKCGEENLTGEDVTQCTCCRTIFRFDKKKSKFRVIQARDKRKVFSKSFKNKLSDKQNGLCFWCGNVFGEYVLKQGSLKRLDVFVEHVNPYSYSYDNGDDNLVASCQICNSWKSSRVFQSEDECRGFLMRKWASWEQRKLIVHVKEIEDKTREIYGRFANRWYSCIKSSSTQMHKLFSRLFKRG